MRAIQQHEVEAVSGGLKMTAAGLSEYYSAIGGICVVAGAEPLALIAFGLAAYFALA
ncbi:MAG: hypothetical protein ACREHG_08325 [Candidatus Saccharimonadales bacterium]